MSFSLLCGPSNSGKVAVIFDGLERSIAANRRCWLVVPASSDARRARIELVHRVGAVTGVEIGTFHQLASWIAGPLDGTIMSPVAARVHVARLVRRSQQLPPGITDFPGYAARAGRYIHEVREARIVDAVSPPMEIDGVAAASEMAAVMARHVPGERQVWAGLATAWDQLMDTHGLVDDVAIARRAFEQLAHPPGNTPDVFVYGFDDMSSVQIAMLEYLGRVAHVTMSLPFVPGRAVFTRRQTLVDRLRHAGATPTFDGPHEVGSSALQRLEQRLFEPTSDPIDDPTHSIQFIESCGALGEAEDIVRCVAELVGSGIPLHEIACITPDPSRNRSLIEACCQRHGIPVIVETSRTLADVPAGRAILDLVAVRVRQDRRAFIRLLRSGFVPTHGADELEHMLQQWIADPELVDAPNRPSIDHAHLPPAIAAIVADIDRETDVRSRPTDSCLQLIDALAELRVHDPGDIRLVRAVESMLFDLERVSAGNSVSWDELFEAVASITLPPRDDRPEHHLVVAPIARVRTDRFRAVIMYGLHTGGFGIPATDEDDEPMQAREAAYVGITRPAEQLRIARQSSGSDGRPISPHPVWRELVRLLPDASHVRRTLGDVLPPSIVLRNEQQVWDAWLNRDEHRVGDHPWEEPVDTAATPLIDTSMSVTELESYVGCPAQWFINRRLIRRDHDITTHRQAIGMLAHHALADLIGNPANISTDSEGVHQATASSTQVEQSVARARAALRHETPVRDVDELAARIIVERVMRGDTVYGDVVTTEQRFGRDDAVLAPIDLDGVRLTGTIDRYDTTAAGDVTLIDYKLTREWSTAGTKLVEAGKLQLALYWYAIASTPGLQPVAALYRPLTGSRPRGFIDAELAPKIAGSYRTDTLDHAEIEQLIDDAVHLATAAVQGVKAGRVTPDPRGGSCPDWCGLETVCRIGERQ